MITARSLFGIRWARVTASPLRLLCLAALLFGFVSMHAVSAEAVSGHLTGCASAPVASAESASYAETGETAETAASAATAGPGAAGGHHDDEAAHSTHECVLAQPEQGPEMTAPCPALWDQAVSGGAPHTLSAHPAATTAAGSPPPDAQRAAVLRI
ncbi:hypothetical protein ABZ370_05585 [Streptomyces sp. NPDC005962]|uniref:hypothetical protein n=1 Tax=Streptomyces sp. NPDC005962 TaxID=3154466 RepID=UPI0033E4FA00